MTDTPPRPPWHDLAGRALQLAVRQDGVGAGDAVAELHRVHGPDAVVQAMQAWADTVLSYSPPPAPGQAMRLGFINADTGKITSAAAVASDQAWAGQLIAARAADDPDMYCALIESTRSDEEWSKRVTAMLGVCALNVRAALQAGARQHTWPEIGARSTS